jgi:hypothetical protein
MNQLPNDVPVQCPHGADAREHGWAAQHIGGYDQAAARSSLSAPRATIVGASSGNGRCKALASSSRRAIDPPALIAGHRDPTLGNSMKILDSFGVQPLRNGAFLPTGLSTPPSWGRFFYKTAVASHDC